MVSIYTIRDVAISIGIAILFPLAVIYGVYTFMKAPAFQSSQNVYKLEQKLRLLKKEGIAEEIEQLKKHLENTQKRLAEKQTELKKKRLFLRKRKMFKEKLLGQKSKQSSSKKFIKGIYKNINSNIC